MITRLFPTPQKQLDIQGLYLESYAADLRGKDQHLVYTNFITSLDGRIAISHPETGAHGVPSMITNRRDWRLYQELAAQADMLIVSGRYLRELAQGKAQAELPLSGDADYADLHAWRLKRGLPPQPAVLVLSASLDLPMETLASITDREVYIATGATRGNAAAIQRIEQTGARVLLAGDDGCVDGKLLVEQLVQRGFRFIYSIAGPGVLETLLRARVLDRMYITQVLRLIGGATYDTLFEGRLLTPAADFELRALYHDSRDGEQSGQLFSVYQFMGSHSDQN